MDATALLRPGLLAGWTIAFGGGAALAPPLAGLGATLVSLSASDDEDAAAEEVRAAVAGSPIDALVHDARLGFAAAGGGADGFRAALDGAWTIVRAVANAAFIADARGGKVVLVAPLPDAGDPHAEAARAALENLARTLSIEWARYGVTTVALTPGASTTDAELASLAAYLASPAGDYFSGCALALA